MNSCVLFQAPHANTSKQKYIFLAFFFFAEKGTYYTCNWVCSSVARALFPTEKVLILLLFQKFRVWGLFDLQPPRVSSCNYTIVYWTFGCFLFLLFNKQVTLYIHYFIGVLIQQQIKFPKVLWCLHTFIIFIDNAKLPPIGTVPIYTPTSHV